MEKISHRRRDTLMLVGTVRRRGSGKEESPTARDMLMVVGYARRVSNEKQTPNKVQTDNPTIVICFGGEVISPQLLGQRN